VSVRFGPSLRFLPGDAGRDRDGLLKFAGAMEAAIRRLGTDP
jgi:hypothetical protein